MRRANLENRRLAWGSMEMQGDEPLFETQAEIDACLAATGVSADQVVRWRRLGLLPDVEQRPLAFHGSETRFPVGMCAQIKAAREFFQQKNRVEYVGWHLWFAGYPVAEEHWRGPLVHEATHIDRSLKFLRRIVPFFDRDEARPALAEVVGTQPIKNIILSRLEPRFAEGERIIFAGVLLRMASGDFDNF